MPNTNARKSRDWFLICSWAFFILAFVGLIVYMSVHVEDLLDSEMSSELILARQLKESGGIFSGNWYYSTEIRVLNTQLVYSLFFHAFEDWQTVRMLGNITLYLLLIGSYYFLCKRLGITRYFPLTAGILLLPLSGWYFSFFLYGTYYMPRVSMMFFILGILMQPPAESRSKTGVILYTLVACLLSLALGMEGARMMLVLFVPVTIVAGTEFFRRVFSQNRENSTKRIALLRQDGFPRYLAQAFFACVFALAGFLINKLILSHAYSFEQFDISIPKITFGSIIKVLTNQIALIGYGTLTHMISVVAWAAAGGLIAWFLLRKAKKPTSALRFLWMCVASWACYTAFCSMFDIGQAAYHMIPVTVLFIPAVAVFIQRAEIKPELRRAICAGLSLCLLLIGLQGYFTFATWSYRTGEEANESFAQIAAVLEEKGYQNGYATHWNANVLTELSDGAIDVWCVEQFDDQTTEQPELDKWLQVKSHDTARPTGKVFLVWTTKQYETYDQEKFDYLGEILYQDDAFVVYNVIQ